MVRLSDDPTVRDVTAGTCLDHPYEFLLERREALDAALDSRELQLGNRRDLCTRSLRLVLQRDQRADGRHLEAKIAGMANEGKPTRVARVIEPPSALRSAWRRQQPDSLVIADCLGP